MDVMPGSLIIISGRLYLYRLMVSDKNIGSYLLVDHRGINSTPTGAWFVWERNLFRDQGPEKNAIHR
jgi:hypothetical protein